ncbi:brain-specific angiogenesis inhibitor 1-associated protein 2-like protein 2 isoform X4 [Salmo salar]|uniref:Brain-specific angiogenesis inhibitor 1-associated protein 2-like protein 2 isoform X4 n=1 Tax=Salmo salar TaxID=8030 RepID=A0A1S3R8Q6_SALSA|nr:brain-specific angiogenesis inhibitor 1-associated protein 2-like protein 2 isoform X4 [Salmo salar]|eukprot:XP_014048139.1 PREDICTED: brain-specific angiogenesis inhibitor 1-associated protein 2-like protein 2 isoform X4 [Salmo salar]
MSGQNCDQLHRSTLGIYASLMDQFNPSLQKLVSLGNSYMQAFQALAVTSEAYFSTLAKIGEQAFHTMSSRSIGDVLIQISENQKRLTTELEGIFRWFHTEVLQEMNNNVKLDRDYIAGSRRQYEMEVQIQAISLERQLRRGAHQVNPLNDEYIHFLRESQREALMEEERRYRFLAEKHCGLTQSIIYLMNKTGAGGGLQQIADGWRDQVNATRRPGSRNPSRLDQDNTSRMREEDRGSQWSGKEEQPLGRVPSRGPSPQNTRSRSSSFGESLGLGGGGGGRPMRALVSHPANSNSPTMLPFSRGEVVSVLVQEPRNGWLYGRAESSSRQGWFPAAYVGTLEEAPRSTGSRSAHSMDNLLDQSGSSSHGRPPPPPPPPPNRQTEMRPITPSMERRAETHSDNKRGERHGGPGPNLFPKGTNPFATVKLKPTSTDDRSAPRLRR